MAKHISYNRGESVDGDPVKNKSITLSETRNGKLEAKKFFLQLMANFVAERYALLANVREQQVLKRNRLSFVNMQSHCEKIDGNIKH